MVRLNVAFLTRAEVKAEGVNLTCERRQFDY
jgi:hypothetical protein